MRSRGLIAMANWTPEGFVGKSFRLTAEMAPPPPGLPAPVLWGDEETVHRRFANGVYCSSRTTTVAADFLDDSSSLHRRVQENADATDRTKRDWKLAPSFTLNTPAVHALLSLSLNQIAPNSELSVSETILYWWKEESAHSGISHTAAKFLATIFEFLRDSTPARRRQRYGDVDFDWDYKVDTTGATISTRDRLLGMFHSPYQPTEPALFHEMMEMLASEFKLDYSQFTFIDIGSGKGRVLLLAADYPFKRIIGVELLPELHHIAQENIAKYKSESQRCFAIGSLCGDAREFQFPTDPILLYLFNPLPEVALRQMLANLEDSLRQHPRPAHVLYHNPLLEHVLTDSQFLRKIGGTHQYAVYASQTQAL